MSIKITTQMWSQPILLCRLLGDGSPAWSECWLDESENKMLKSIAASAFAGAVFHPRVLATWAFHEGRKGEKRKAA